MRELNDERPVFFKVFIPKFSSKQMLIPPAFVRQYVSKTAKKTKLKDECGQCWNVAMVTCENRLYFGDGWVEFCKGHSLEFGDFLLFKYSIVDSSFGVDIFGKNGCKKELTASPSKLLGPMETKEDTIDEDRRRIGWKKKSGPSDESQVKATKYRSSRIVMAKNFQFSIMLRTPNSFQRGVAIPRSVMGEIKFKPNCALQSQDNKLWPVTVKPQIDGRGSISTGWSNFRKAHNLKANDKCVFEPILTKGKVCGKIKIKVVRGRSKNH